MIQFFEEDISYKLPHPHNTAEWLTRIITSEGFELGEINYIFCSDEHLLSINQTYLKHDTYTDIVTFDQSEETEIILTEQSTNVLQILNCNPY